MGEKAGRVRRWLTSRLWWLYLVDWWRRHVRDRWLGRLYEYQTAKRLLEAERLVQPSAEAMVKVYGACPWIPPDTVSAGILRGGEALFFRHNDATEVFIGNDYDHAADKLIEWLTLQGDELKTSETTKMNRQHRRAYASHFKKKGKK